jgi:hypothetical protein
MRTQAAVVHYLIAKVFGPMLFGRIWCGWACWTVMVLDLLRSSFEMPLYNAARLFHIEDYGIVEGNTANLVILPVNSIVDAIRFHPSPTLVMREGRVLIQTKIQRETDPSIPT